MRARDVLLVLLNLALVAKVFTPLLAFVVLLATGYLLVLHAAVVGPRLRGAAARVVPAATLVLWTLVWLATKPGGGLAGLLAPVSRAVAGLEFPFLGLPRDASIPTIVGSSYVFLKVFALIRDAQRGAPPPGFLAYVAQMAFFPSFAAGPIAGAAAFEQGFRPSRALAAEGLSRALLGVLKLYVLAELLAPANLLGGVPSARSIAAQLTHRELWLCLYASALWIYLNFAGYSDLAIGAGLLLGIRLPENFDAPYLAPSPSEFWQRWHMSFTTWLREHVFAPVSRWLAAAGQGGTLTALVLSTTATMVFCGLWHRVSLELLVWGLYHAVVVLAHQTWASRLRPRLAKAGLAGFFAGPVYRALATLATFHAIALGWVLFLPIDAPLGDRLFVLGRILFLC